MRICLKALPLAAAVAVSSAAFAQDAGAPSAPYRLVDTVAAGCDPASELAAKVSYADVSASVTQAMVQAAPAETVTRNRRGRKVEAASAPVAPKLSDGIAAVISVDLTVCFSPFQMRTVEGSWTLRSVGADEAITANGSVFDEGVTMIYQVLGVPGRSSGLSLALVLEDVPATRGDAGAETAIYSRVALGPERSS